MSEHTKTPWGYEEGVTPFYNDANGYSCGGNGAGYAEVYQVDDKGETLWGEDGEPRLVNLYAIENAALIVTAVNAYEPDQARIAELEAVLDRIILVAKMLQQNAEGCAINHYGHDFEVHGLPGWLADTRVDIEAAISARAALDRQRAIESPDWAFLHGVADALTALASQEGATSLCSDCPREGYPTDETRCLPCPRRQEGAQAGEVVEAEQLLRRLKHRIVYQVMNSHDPDALAIEAFLNRKRPDIAATPPAPDDAVRAEPEGWCQPMRSGEHMPRQFIVRFDDQDRGDAVFDNEDEAYEFWERANFAWNCYLFGAMPLRARKGGAA